MSTPTYIYLFGENETNLGIMWPRALQRMLKANEQITLIDDVEDSRQRFRIISERQFPI